MDAQSTAALTVLCHFLSTLVAVPVFLIIIGGPAWMIVKLAKIRAGERLNTQDAAVISDMTARLHRMDERMATLESILDAQVPAWRESPMADTYGRQAG
jgi:phage shock protein B